MGERLNDVALDTILRTARSYNRWNDKPVSDTELEDLYDLMKWGPTSANCSPARFVFVRSAEAKAKLISCVIGSNAFKIEQAPVTVIIGYDNQFFEEIPRLFPHNPGAREWFSGDAELAEATAFRNSSLQGAYLMIAARALGLDCGPMSGFDNGKVDDAFFNGTTVKSNFICTLGHGSTEELYDRSPRLPFEDACTLA
ncbi:MAG: malonic semialdehyde reductase [Pseudomonadota bacterium]